MEASTYRPHMSGEADRSTSFVGVVVLEEIIGMSILLAKYPLMGKGNMTTGYVTISKLNNGGKPYGTRNLRSWRIIFLGFFLSKKYSGPMISFVVTAGLLVLTVENSGWITRIALANLRENGSVKLVVVQEP